VTPSGPELVEALRGRLDEMTAQLELMVNAESPSGDPARLAGCASVIEDVAFALIGIRPQCIEVDSRRHLLWELGSGPPAAALIGHYDTVWPAGTLARWPFSVGDGRASGPGALDMKAGIVVALHAASIASVAVRILLTADEEVGSPTSRALVEDTARGLPAALVLEPSLRGALKLARKGTGTYEVAVEGRAAHAGLEPDKGVNATVELAHQVLAAAALARPEVGTTVTPTLLSAGTTTNTVPGAGVLHVDVRVADPADALRVDAGMRALAPVVAGARLFIGGGMNRPPLPRSASEALFSMAQRVAPGLGLDPPAGVEVGGGSDGNFTAAAGVPTLDGLGPDGDGAHAEGEHVLLASMPERAALVAGLLRALAGVG
jgi:glutamate carboxypeptidase